MQKLVTLGIFFLTYLAPYQGFSAEKNTALPASVVISTDWKLQDAAKVSLNGGELSQASFQPSDWYPATVPGTVLTTLVNNKVYPEPLYGENNRPDKIPDTLCRTDWWYRTSFTVPEDYAGKTVWLNFDGINYAAEVWVNGHAIGKMKGAFIRGIFDITPYVTAGKAATLAVRVSPEPTPGETTEHTIRLGTGNNFCVTPADGPTFLCTIGWDWLPTIRDRNTGIWQKVFLSATGPAVIKDPLVTTDLPLPRTDSADIDIKATVQNVMDSPLNGELEASFDGITIRQNVSLKPGGSQQVSFDPSQFPQLHVMNPKLWWPNGFGEPNLHLLRLVLKTEGKISDAQEFNFGIRKITYTNPPSDNLAFSVNGVPIFAKGGNWGLDEALKRIPRERLEAQVKMHQLANYTMIRNWVGQSTGPDLYDLCDKYGILLWDEFFQPSGGAPMPVDFDAYMANVKDKMLRFRNHPCIAIWCARNEGNPPKNIDDAIRGLMKELEPARLYQPNSKDGRGVRSGGPYGWRTPEQYYEYPPEESFKTESGSVSIPTIESIQGMMPEKDWESINDDWAEHDLTRGAQERRPYLKTLENRYGKAVNLADFVRKGQMMNYEAFRAMYEGRLAKLFNPETGVLTWMSHPAQPSFVWQIYHYDLEPNAALFAARKACEPIHIMLNEKELKIQVVNNLPTPLKGAKASISIYNLEGTKVSEKVIPVEAAPSTATDLGPVSWPQPPLPVEFVRLELRDATGALISDNFYWRGDSSKTGDLTALEKLPPVTLDADSIFHEVGSNILTEVTLSNPSKSVALMVHLQLHRSGDGKRVLPAYYSDNYFSLVPGGKKVVTIEASKKSMEGQDPLVLIDGFNLVGVKNESSGRVSVKLNENAQVSHWPQHGMKIDYGTPQSEYQMNCGGDDVAAFKSDEGYGRGSKMSVKTPIDTSDPLSAPEAVYQSCRFRKASYLFAMKPPEPGHSYKVRLHFAELQFNAPDKRKMDVKINGKTAIKDLDVFQTAGAMNKAVVKEVHGVLPDEDGKIDIDPVSAEGRKDTPAINGIEILPE